MLKNSTTSSSVIVHIKSVFARHGVPDEVMSDNGPQFHCKEFTEFAKQWGFMHTVSSPLFPQSNGLAERSVQTVKRLLKKALAEGRDPYHSLFILRTTPVESIGGSPAQLLMGRRLKSNLPMTHQLLN